MNADPPDPQPCLKYSFCVQMRKLFGGFAAVFCRLDVRWGIQLFEYYLFNKVLNKMFRIVIWIRIGIIESLMDPD